MPKTLAALLLVCCGVSVAAAQTADEIVAQNAAARGGAAAWRALQSMKMSGSMEVGRGLAVPFRLELKRPRRMRLEFEFEGATAVQTFDGVNGWKVMPFLGRSDATPLSEGELATAAGQAEIDGPLIDYRSKGHTLEFEGKDTVEGREAYKLKLTFKNGAVRRVYVDVQSGLEVKLEATHKVRGADKRLDTFLRDYRKVEGLMIPHVLESKVEGAPTSHKLTINVVELNKPLADARFGKPVEAAAKAANAEPRQATPPLKATP